MKKLQSLYYSAAAGLTVATMSSDAFAQGGVGKIADNISDSIGSFINLFSTISYVGGPSISCPECYLAIKDGNQVPSYYFYDLSAWDGISDIIMTGFWPGKGAISHVSIWGGPGEEEGEEEGGQEEEGSTIPEPASVLLIGLGMAAVAARMRQRKA